MPPCIAYTLRFADARQHYIDIEAHFPAQSAATPSAEALASEPLTLRMAVWTPGSYMVREYARHLEAVAACYEGGDTLNVTKSKKNHWQLWRDPSRSVLLRYRVYAREMTVRTNWVDRDFALLNGAPTFLSAVGMQHLPHTVRVELAPGWGQTIVALPQLPGNGAYVAPDYDTLVDTPWLLGNPDLRAFDAGARPHLLATVGGEGAFDYARAQSDTARIVQQHQALWGTVPYPNYVFMNVLSGGRGGLEHKDSSVLMASPHATSSRAEYLDWLGLVSHEFFHVWNIKRLRPLALGPFDYDAEVVTPSLWIAEGLTAYYDDLQVHRAQLCTQAEYLTRLSRTIEQVQSTPGRLVQTLTAASYDAWIKLYRRDENTDNSAISYYLKGSIVGFLLDAQVRQLTRGAACLDTIMRLAYSRYAGAQGYSDAQFRAVAIEVAGHDLTAFFAASLDSTAELDYAPALASYGLVFDAAPEAVAQPSHEAPEGWLGLSTRVDAGRLLVSQVRRQTPAYIGGVNVDDEIIAWDGFRVTPESFAARLRHTDVGRTAPLVVARRERLIALPLCVQARPQLKWHLKVDTKATPEQRQQLAAWLGSSRLD